MLVDVRIKKSFSFYFTRVSTTVGALERMGLFLPAAPFPPPMHMHTHTHTCYYHYWDSSVEQSAGTQLFRTELERQTAELLWGAIM